MISASRPATGAREPGPPVPPGRERPRPDPAGAAPTATRRGHSGGPRRSGTDRVAGAHRCRGRPHRSRRRPTLREPVAAMAQPDCVTAIGSQLWLSAENKLTSRGLGQSFPVHQSQPHRFPMRICAMRRLLIIARHCQRRVHRLHEARDIRLGHSDHCRGAEAGRPPRRRHRDSAGHEPGAARPAEGLRAHRREHRPARQQPAEVDSAAEHLELGRGHPRVGRDGEGLLRRARLPADAGLRRRHHRVRHARQPGRLRQVRRGRREDAAHLLDVRHDAGHAARRVAQPAVRRRGSSSRRRTRRC